MSVAEFLHRLKGVRRLSEGWQARCPAHDDIHPSLSVTERDDKLLLFCHAGCPIERVIGAMGLEMRDLNGTKPRMVTYDYTDEKGALLFQVVRYHPKAFKQRRPDGQGGWIWNLKGVPRVLYRLPEVSRSETVVVVEGEKDVETARKLGFTATCNPGGAGKWRRKFSDALSEKNVIVIPDNDEPGRKHGLGVAATLVGEAASVKVVEIPNAKDLTEWCEAGGTLEQLVALVNATSKLSEPVETKQTRHSGLVSDFRLTDVSNAQQFAARYAEQLRYCHDWREWLVWDGTRWQRDRLEQVRLLAAELVQEMRREAAELIDSVKRDELWRWARTSEHTQRITSMLREAQPQPAFRITSDQFDSDAWLLNCVNGTLDLRTGELRKHRREDFLTKLAGASYIREAECPRWLQFLDEVTARRVELVEYLALAVGYALTGITREQVFFLLYGCGDNGKSKMLETLRAVFGDYATDTEFKTFLEQRDYGITNDIARLKGARLVTAKEVAQGRTFNEPLLKMLTGEDTVTARRLYQEAFEFRPQFKLFLAANHKPIIRDSSHALWRRVHPIPFDVTFRDELKDRDLAAKLHAELAGILAWAVRGCQAWQTYGLGMPPAVAQATADYREEMDVVSSFISVRCVVDSGASERIGLLYEAFLEWAKEDGERVVTKRAFAECLRERGFSEAPGHKAGRRYFGLRLATGQARGTQGTQ